TLKAEHHVIRRLSTYEFLGRNRNRRDGGNAIDQVFYGTMPQC
ncbi:MAG: hypothetical protein ACI9OH_003817, partial [Oleispira sp.]